MIAHRRLSGPLHVLRDKDIRLRIRAYFEVHHPTSLIIDELPIRHHATRADIVAVGNDTLDAFEIKSDVDDLRRFESQQTVYDSVFDSVTIVTTMRHVSNVVATVPSSVGIMIVDGERSVLIQRAARERHQPNTSNSLGLLTRAELQLICRLNALPARDPHRDSLMWRVMQGCSANEIRLLVRETLRFRYGGTRLKGQNPSRIWLEETSMWWAIPTAPHRGL
jgi:hypothetical protein